ncbi:inhibitory synaptic factor 2A isoform X1 [Sturnira hondurensis]|uniref:inhibitory synaptic factor 2A isoform X1 n=2 Tax=Sturnira hondurensis TaxID=192404 RepID=UPI00187AEC46|nr:inhibitory synaptic factor 2A isoform X1 [Sturnira hondurensis]
MCPHAGTMVSKDAGECALATSESDVEPAACLALEMKYALDPNRQIKKRNKALQVRFKDICEAQSEQRDEQLPGGPGAERREARPASHRAAYRKYMTVPARRSIPNVTKSTGVQTSPDLKKCYQTFPLDRKKGTVRSVPTSEAFKSQNNGFVIDAKDKSEEGLGEEGRPWAAGRVQMTTALVFHSHEHMDTLERPAGVNCVQPCRNTGVRSCPDAPLHNAPRPPPREPHYKLHGAAKQDRDTLDTEEPAPSAHGRVFKTEVATVYAPAPGTKALEPALSNSATGSAWSLGPAAAEEQSRAAHPNGLQAPLTQCLSPSRSDQPPQTMAPAGPEPQPCPTAVAVGEECQQIVPRTEVVDLKAQLQVMENLISASQETIKVLLGVIQELEKGEAHREGLSYRTGQDTANCDTCRNSACIIYSVELDFKQQEDKLRPVLRELPALEETQVAPSPYSQETASSTPKQKSKTESKKHGRWKLWFL